MTGITRSAAAKIIAEHFDTSAVHVSGTYDTYTVEDDTGRKWKVVSDASIQCQSRGERTASRLYAVEVVSPICKYEDIETIQELVRELRRGGAKVNDSCGIHIHVDATNCNSRVLCTMPMLPLRRRKDHLRSSVFGEFRNGMSLIWICTRGTT